MEQPEAGGGILSRNCPQWDSGRRGRFRGTLAPNLVSQWRSQRPARQLRAPGWDDSLSPLFIPPGTQGAPFVLRHFAEFLLEQPECPRPTRDPAA